MQYIGYNWNGQLLTLVEAQSVESQSDDKSLLSDVNTCMLFINANVF